MAGSRQPESLISGFLRSLYNGPNRIALELGDQLFTYAELWRRAATIAAALDSSLRSDDPLVALFASRSVAAYSGVVGILATGRGYVPLNPSFPPDRTLSMISAAGCNAVIVGPECVEAVTQLLPRIERPLTWIFPDEDCRIPKGVFTRHRAITTDELQETAEPIEPTVGRDAPAYLLFTSGSTGIPKAVAVSHANVTSYLRFAEQRYGVRAEDRCSQNFDLTFDLSVHDLFVSWNGGATLCPFTDRYLVPASVIDDKRLTVWFSVPSVAAFAMKLGLLSPGAFSSLRLSLFCGEALSARLATAWQDAAPDSIVENIYGPTEATIAISHYRWDSSRSPGECTNGIVPLGWMFDKQECRVVDEDLAVVGDGEVGELCLSGSQITAGYFNDPVRTSVQFVQLPGSNATWYLTGDLVRRDQRGCLYYIGRKDHQVKINGYRVELQEIEHVLREATHSELAVAVPWPAAEGTASGIVAVVGDSGPRDDNQIISLCRSRLPQYMVPTRVCHVEHIPLTANGKIDRKRIPALIHLADAAS